MNNSGNPDLLAHTGVCVPYTVSCVPEGVVFMCDSERIIQVCVDENGHWDGDEGRMELHVWGGQTTSLCL